MADLREYNCKRCGGKLKKEGEIYRCESCGAEFSDGSDAIAKVLDERREREIANLRALLYDAVRETYQDDEKIRSLCREIKRYAPNDFQATFYDIAASTSGDRLNAFLLGMDVEKYALFVPDVVEFVLRSLEKSNVNYLKALVERAFRDEERTEYYTKIEAEAEKVDLGIYVPSLTRNVFVAHSSADYKRVLPVVEKLEARGITCFVAQRNLRHGRGAVADYGKNLETAMRSTQCFLFFSSKNSRKPDCEALTREIPYVRDHLPRKARIEYLLDDYDEHDRAIKATLSTFFFGKEHCRTPEDLAARLYSVMMGGEEENKPAVKYCLNCGTENPAIAKCCLECGGKEFAATKDEYYRIQNEKEIEKAKNDFSDALMRQQRELEEKMRKEREAHEKELEEARKEKERIERERAEALKEAERAREIKERAEKEAEEAKRAAEARAREAEEARLRAERESADRIRREAEVAAAAAKQRKEAARESRRQARREFFGNLGGVFQNIGGGVGGVFKKIGETFAMTGVTFLWLITIALGLFNYIFPLTNYIWYGSGLSVVWYCTLVAEVVFVALTIAFTVNQIDWIYIPCIVFLCAGLFFLILGGMLGSNAFWVSFGLSIAFTALGGVALFIITCVHLDFVFDESLGYKEFTGVFPLFALFFLILSIFGGVIWGTDQCDGMDGKFCYKLLDDGTITVYVLEHDDSELEIPEEVHGNTVSKVSAAWSGRGNGNLEKVVLPRTLTTIDYGAFENCTSLKTLIVPSGNYIHVYDGAFRNCASLEEFETEDDGAYTIFLREGAFEGCSSLEKIKISGSVPKRAFYGCSSLKEIDAGFSHSEWSVGDEAFAYSGIASFDFGGSLVSVGKEAFKGSAITSVKLGGSLEVGERAFEDCTKLETVEFGLETLPERLFRGCTGLKSISLDVKEIPEGAFENCTSLASVSFGEKLQKIGENAFAGSGLTALEINNKFLAIGEGAFGKCRSLTAVNIDCENIPRGAFSDCTALKEVTIGANVYSAEARSFAGTTALETLTVSGGDIKEKAFEGSGLKALTLKGGRCDNYAFEKLPVNTVTVENGEISLGKGCFKGCASLKEAVLDLELLPESCFENCTLLEKVTFGEGLREVGEKCFKNCTSLREGSADCVILGKFAYENCTALQTVVFAERLETVGEGAFKRSGLPELVLENKELNLGNFAFEGCERLSNVQLDCNTVGEGAFRNCKKLTEASVNCSSVSKSAFAFCEKLATVTVGAYAVKICGAAFEGCTSLQTVAFHGGRVEGGVFKNSGGPRTLTAENTTFEDGACKDSENLRTLTVTGGRIGYNVFEHCENLREATLNCLVVGLEAFKNCASLQTVTIGENCVSISGRAFEGCEHLTSAVFLSPDGWQSQNLFWWHDVDLSDAARAAAELRRESAPTYQKN